MSNPTRQLSGVCEISTGAFVPASFPPAYQGEAQAIEVNVRFTQNGNPYQIPDSVTPYLYLYYDVKGAHTTARPMTKGGDMGDAAFTRLTINEQALPGAPFLVVRLADDDGDAIVSFAERINIQRMLGEITINTVSPEALERAIARANAAAESAEQAASAISGLTASAETLSEDSAASAEVSDVGGVKHIEFGIPKGPRGEPGQGLQILGVYETLADLQAARPTGNPGDAYAVGTPENNTIYIWDIDRSAWVEFGSIGGTALPINGVAPGPDGYELFGTDIPVSEDDARTIKEALDEAGGGDVATVNGEGPGGSGNVQLNADKIPAYSPGADRGAIPDSDVQALLDTIAKVKAKVDALTGIGCYYETENSDNDPNALFGGTWIRVSGFLVGADGTAENPNGTYGAVGSTGGSATHANALGDNAFAGASATSVGGTGMLFAQKELPNGGSYPVTNKLTGGTISTDTTQRTVGTILIGETDEASNLPPYRVTYRWRRIA